MNWLGRLNANPIPWLLEEDDANPGVRYFTLLELSGDKMEQSQVGAARDRVMQSGAVPVILQAQLPEGNWIDRKSVYNPKYRATVWSVCMLAQLGADGADPRIAKACDYVLEHAHSRYGGFSVDDSPAGMIHCLQGNLVAAMLDLGQENDPRFLEALGWMARSVIGEGIEPAEEKDAEVRYYRSGNSGPGFLCSANSHRACAWGAVKVMLDAYTEGRIDRLFLIDNEFVNTMTQRPAVNQLLPIPPSEEEELRHHWDYIYEPDSKDVLGHLLMRYIESQVYQGAVENVACEMAARMVAMKAASDNAGSLSEELQ